VRLLFPTLIKTIKKIKSNSITKTEEKEAEEMLSAFLEFNFVFQLN